MWPYSVFRPQWINHVLQPRTKDCFIYHDCVFRDDHCSYIMVDRVCRMAFVFTHLIFKWSIYWFNCKCSMNLYTPQMLRLSHQGTDHQYLRLNPGPAELILGNIHTNTLYINWLIYSNITIMIERERNERIGDTRTLLIHVGTKVKPY